MKTKEEILKSIIKYISEKEEEAFYSSDCTLGQDNEWLGDGSEHKNFISQSLDQYLSSKMAEVKNVLDKRIEELQQEVKKQLVELQKIITIIK